MTITEVCPRCGLQVSGTGPDELAQQRLRNNMRLHRGGSRCDKRAYYQRRDAEAAQEATT